MTDMVARWEGHITFIWLVFPKQSRQQLVRNTSKVLRCWKTTELYICLGLCSCVCSQEHLTSSTSCSGIYSASLFSPTVYWSSQMVEFTVVSEKQEGKKKKEDIFLLSALPKLKGMNMFNSEVKKTPKQNKFKFSLSNWVINLSQKLCGNPVFNLWFWCFVSWIS